MADEAFHEIQLNGKQLVFLFMAATVVAVVIFLCGVMVGRGVRIQRPGEPADVSTEATVDPTAALHTSPTSGGTSRSSSGSATVPSPTDENLSYPDRLSEPSASPEPLSEPAPQPRAAQRAPSGSRQAENRTSGARSASDAAPAPAGDGFTVQVAAVKERGEADTIARRLSTKGYPAYVMAPASGAPRVFRVRVGRFKDRRQAESIAGRLQREEQFRPWITR